MQMVKKMNKFNNKIIECVKSIIFTVVEFLLLVFGFFALFFSICEIEILGAIFFSIVVAIFGTLALNLVRLLIGVE